jgi:uncharacterized protein
MRVRRCGDVEEYLVHAGEFLVAREAEHNLILGLCGRLRRERRPYGNDPYLAVAEEGDRVVAAVLRTPPHNLVLSEVDDAQAIEPLTESVRLAFEALPGVLGPTKPAARFVGAWEAGTGVHGRRVLAQRIYRAETVLVPRGVPGGMRPYADADRPLVLSWLDAFVAEALPEAPPEPAADLLERRLREPEGGLALWEDGEPVSFASFGGSTPNGIRVGPVYTPPERRRRGYASALVAELTRELLARGRRFCFLFTDLANPTSNTIYQEIGYRPVADVDQWAFDSGPRQD